MVWIEADGTVHVGRSLRPTPCCGDQQEERSMSDTIPIFKEHDSVRLMQTDSVPKHYQNKSGIVIVQNQDEDGHAICEVMVQGVGLLEVYNYCLMGV